MLIWLVFNDLIEFLNMLFFFNYINQIFNADMVFNDLIEFPNMLFFFNYIAKSNFKMLIWLNATVQDIGLALLKEDQ